MIGDAGGDIEGADTAVCDPETLADLADVFGRERLTKLLAGLDEEIVNRLETPAADTAGIGANAHALVSVSGTLGFSSLSRACISLEMACLDGGDVAGALQAAQAEAARARPVIANLRAAGCQILLLRRNSERKTATTQAAAAVSAACPPQSSHENHGAVPVGRRILRIGVAGVVAHRIRHRTGTPEALVKVDRTFA